MTPTTASPAARTVLPVLQSHDETRRNYDRLARYYDILAERSEEPARRAGLTALAAQPGEHILEVGCGTGAGLAEIARSTAPDGFTVGIDLSLGMLRQSDLRAHRDSVHRDSVRRDNVVFPLLSASDATAMPFDDDTFDAVFISFVLELFDTPEIPKVLAECRRILRPGGRLVVIGLSKEKHDWRVRALEWTHEHLPSVMDCRPIYVRHALEEAGFQIREAHCESVWVQIEIVLAEVPAAEMEKTMKEPAAPSEAKIFDRELIRRYDRPGPRYTSYPTAPWFRDDFGPAAYEDLLRDSAERGGPLSLYLHLPFCKTLCLYCGCNVQISSQPERRRVYLQNLMREIDMASDILLGEHERDVVQIHFGGGTPTFFAPDELSMLTGHLIERFHFGDNLEFGVEVDPRTCTLDHLDVLAAAGVNRLSVGVQDLHPMVQQAVRRIHPAEVVGSVIDGARERGIGSVNVDLMYGLPHQTPERFARTLERVLEMKPDRLAVFNFAYLPTLLPHQRALPSEAMPSPEMKLDLLELSIETLTAAGYVMIGMDHFAHRDDPLAQALREGTLTRNFQGYSTFADVDMVGFGASAIGDLAGGFAQNTKRAADYEKAIEAGGFATCRGLRRTEEDNLRSDVIRDLMCRLELDFAHLGEQYGIDFESHFASELQALAPLEADGLLRREERKIVVTPAGQLLVRNIAMAFDAYLENGGATYSRTV